MFASQEKLAGENVCVVYCPVCKDEKVQEKLFSCFLHTAWSLCVVFATADRLLSAATAPEGKIVSLSFWTLVAEMFREGFEGILKGGKLRFEGKQSALRCKFR